MNFKQKNAFKYKVDNCLSNQFDVAMSQQMSKTLIQDNTCAIALIMFYNNNKSLTFMVLGVVVYCFIEKYVCVDYLILQREPKLSASHKKIEDTSFEELSGIVIPEILLNILSCCGFSNTTVQQ